MWMLYTHSEDNIETELFSKQYNVMNEYVSMRVCGNPYLFLDGRFSSGAASVWPAESDTNITVVTVVAFPNPNPNPFTRIW